jgi:hypothetical protein
MPFVLAMLLGGCAATPRSSSATRASRWRSSPRVDLDHDGRVSKEEYAQLAFPTSRWIRGTRTTTTALDPWRSRTRSCAPIRCGSRIEGRRACTRSLGEPIPARPPRWGRMSDPTKSRPEEGREVISRPAARMRRSDRSVPTPSHPTCWSCSRRDWTHPGARLSALPIQGTHGAAVRDSRAGRRGVAHAGCGRRRCSARRVDRPRT